MTEENITKLLLIFHPIGILRLRYGMYLFDIEYIVFDLPTPDPCEGSTFSVI
jgi:hypothetical protein